MKKRTIILAVITMLVSITSLAQKAPVQKKDNLLFLLRQAEHINQAIKTVDQLMVNNNSQVVAGNVVIIVCGEVVTSLTTKDGEEWVQKLAKFKNVSLVACGLSLDKFDKKESDLIQGVSYTRNGFIKAFELQKKGYLSVEL